MNDVHKSYARFAASYFFDINAQTQPELRTPSGNSPIDPQRVEIHHDLSLYGEVAHVVVAGPRVGKGGPFVERRLEQSRWPGWIAYLVKQTAPHWTDLQRERVSKDWQALEVDETDMTAAEVRASLANGIPVRITTDPAEIDAIRRAGPHALGCPAFDEDPDGIEQCECEPQELRR